MRRIIIKENNKRKLRNGENKKKKEQINSSAAGHVQAKANSNLVMSHVWELLMLKKSLVLILQHIIN